MRGRDVLRAGLPAAGSVKRVFAAAARPAAVRSVATCPAAEGPTAANPAAARPAAVRSAAPCPAAEGPTADRPTAARPAPALALALALAVPALTLTLAVPAGAEVLEAGGGDVRVWDGAGILTSFEENELLEAAEALSDESGFEIMAVTTDDAGGLSAQEYAEQYFEYYSSDYEGGIYLIDMDNRELYVATYGDLRYVLTDARLDLLLDDAYEYASSGDYGGALLVMLRDTQQYVEEGVQEGTVLYDEDTGSYTYYEEKKTVTPTNLLVSLGAALAGFFSLFGSVTGRYGMKKKEEAPFSLRDNVKMQLTRVEDQYVRNFVTQRRIPRNPPPGSGGGGGHFGGGGGGHISTTHHTSGGHSAGGGGRKF